MTMNTTYPAVEFMGSVSHATMRNEDLIPEFIYVLGKIDKAAHAKIVAEYPAILDSEEPDYDSEESDYCMESLFDALAEVAPPFCYFGSHPGDGSDYGFWPCEDLEESVIDDGGVVVSDYCDVPNGFIGYVLHVSDHGNATLSYTDGSDIEEIWAIV